MQDSDSLVQKGIDLYDYGRDMMVSRKSDQVTMVSELCIMLPLVHQWIEKATNCL